jgi:eukaryotic-like serine/threonine-protein kinase
MADVFVCRLSGIGGFEKELVVKRILPERAGDPHFLEMFLDEARVVAHLDHPNIVQVFEIGEDNGIPFMAMEYVKGVTLSRIIQSVQAQAPVRFRHLAKIVCGVCDALDYAHNALGPDGEPLGLVHRDVTPGNIMVSLDGIPKLLDFGVARAKGRLAHTQAGVRKGKPRYMAPELASDAPLDHRADLFGLGVCLFELTVGRSPFGTEDDDELVVFRNIVQGSYRKPSDLVAGYPPALERAVLWAIEPDVEKRCPTASALRERLDAFIATEGGEIQSRDLTSWLQELLPELADWKRTGAPLPVTEVTAPVALPVRAARPASTASRDPKGLWGVLLGALALVSMSGAAIWYLTRGDPGAPEPAARSSQAAPGNTDDEAAAAYLAAAERLADEGRLEPSLDMLSAAGKLDVRRPDLYIRLAQLRDRLTTESLLRKAAGHLSERQWQSAADAARSALDRDPRSPRAVQLLASARAGLASRHLDPPKARGARPPGTRPRQPPSSQVPRADAPLPPQVVETPPVTGARAREASVLLASPEADVPKPALPRSYLPRDAADMRRMCLLVESTLVSLAGLQPAYVAGITQPLQRLVGAHGEIYPVAMYYFLLGQALHKQDRETAAANLTSAQSSRLILKFKDLPAQTGHRR